MTHFTTPPRWEMRKRRKCGVRKTCRNKVYSEGEVFLTNGLVTYHSTVYTIGYTNVKRKKILKTDSCTYVSGVVAVRSPETQTELANCVKIARPLFKNSEDIFPLTKIDLERVCT